MRHFHLLLFRRHTSARLPPVTHPPTPRTYVSPTCGFDVNEQKRILSGKQPGVPHPTPGYLYCVHQARVTIGTGDHDGRRTKKNGEKTRKEKERSVKGREDAEFPTGGWQGHTKNREKQTEQGRYS